MKILIVDDAKLMRSIIKNAVKDIPGILMLEATNGDEAIELFKATKPDLITMDITMEYKNGVEAAKEILKLDPATKIIMVTALGQENLLKECIEMGVKDFIVKPFTPDRIMSAVQKVMGI